MSDSVTKHLLHLDQIRGYERASLFASREHEVEDYFLVFNQVVVEEDPPALVGDHWYVGEVPSAD